jgi:hypothetical protein
MYTTLIVMMMCFGVDYHTSVQQNVDKITIFLKKVARARLGSEPGIFCFCLFSHSTTLPLSHSAVNFYNAGAVHNSQS